MLPYEYRIVKIDKVMDLIKLINDNFGTFLTDEKIEKSIFKLKKDEGNFYKTSNAVGFTLFKSNKSSFNSSFFSLDLDGTADGIEKELKVTSDHVLIVKNHPFAFIKFSLKCEIDVEIIKVKDESILCKIHDENSCKNHDTNSCNSCKIINEIHIKPNSIQKYSDEFYEKSILTLDNFFTNSFNNFEDVESWQRAGPADFRNFKYNLKDNEINSLMKCKEFITWLSSVTGLPLLHPAVPVYTRCLQSAGDYQILHGNYSEPLGLDVIYSFYPLKDFKEWPEKFCGRIHYLNDSGDEIFQVNPVNNSLTIVYRTEGCSRFTENVKGSPDIHLFQTIGIYSVAAEVENT